jgi:hypothetical protein
VIMRDHACIEPSAVRSRSTSFNAYPTMTLSLFTWARTGDRTGRLSRAVVAVAFVVYERSSKSAARNLDLVQAVM